MGDTQRPRLACGTPRCLNILVAVPHLRGFLDPSPSYQSLCPCPLQRETDPPGLDPVLLEGLASSKPGGYPLSAQICTVVAL